MSSIDRAYLALLIVWPMVGFLAIESLGVSGWYGAAVGLCGSLNGATRWPWGRL